jgi:SpoVK/Ycf46/Vps4 family AAA+-type ATPase
VFLRLLEYYHGVLFLTTNRVETFDPAFKSRIDLNIKYPDLDEAARREVWETFTRESQRFPRNGSSLSATDVDHLASLELNGREIKNIVKSARLLALADTQRPRTLAMSDIHTVLEVQGISIKKEK